MAPEKLKVGIKVNLDQFILQLLLVFFVGITVGLERNIVPILGKEEFGVASFSILFSFIVSFGLVKALLNLLSGVWADRWGRRRLLILGWLVAIPVPLIIIWAQSWFWVTIANIFLGINQGLTWTMTQTSKLDMASEGERGLAAGLNEWGGYFGVAVATIVTGYLASVFGIRPIPFYFGLGVIVLALIISLVCVKETLPDVQGAASLEGLSKKWETIKIVKRVSWVDKSLFACSQAGLVEKFVDVLVWVAFPLFFHSLSIDRIGILVGSYGLSWGFLQLVVGPVSDRVGRKWVIGVGMWISGLGILLTTLGDGFNYWLFTSILTGVGMALLYPTLIAAVSDLSHPTWRASALGVYRMWRDLGYAIGAIVIGLFIDDYSLSMSFYFTAFLMFVSGSIIFVIMN
jgi:MFS family permease